MQQDRRSCENKEDTMPEPEDIKAEDTTATPESEDIEVVAHGDLDESALDDNVCYTNNRPF